MPIVEEPLEVMSRSKLVVPPRKKRTGHGNVPQQRFKATHDAEGSGSGFAIIFLGYIPLRKDDAPRINISKNSKYMLVSPSITKGIHVVVDILSNPRKMGFIDHDLTKFPELTMSQYMTYVRETEDGPIHLVLMEWA